MTSDANLCSICGKSKVADPASPDAHCKGHAAAGDDLKAQLDAIKAPGTAAAPTATPPQPAKVVPPPVPAPKPAVSQQDLKSQLDAIPSPGAPKAVPAPAPAKTSEPSIADQLAAIPTPGAKTPPPASITKNQLDAIPTPGTAAPAPKAPAAAPPSAALSFQDQLNAIPTPGMNRPAGTSGEQANLNDLNSIPTPTARPGGAPPAPSADQPQWMKNYNSYQSGITASSASGFPTQDPYANYQPQNREAPAAGGGGYMLVAIFVGVIMIAYFVFLTQNKPAPLDTNQLGNPTGSPSATSSTMPPSTAPGQTPVSQPSGFMQPPESQQPQGMPAPVQ